jgi:hypothetical protein
MKLRAIFSQNANFRQIFRRKEKNNNIGPCFASNLIAVSSNYERKKSENSILIWQNISKKEKE